jgi:Carboxypeptidase regulatory-like domain
MKCGKHTTSVKLPLQGLAVFFLFACLASPTAVRAQATATINGTVRDSTGAVIPDATVTLHSAETNLDRNIVTNNVGAYLLPQIHPGEYSLKVSKNGFKTEVKKSIRLDVNQTATIDVVLSAGSTQETVEVQATAATLETSTSELGEAIVKRQVSDLPLNGRNFTQMLNLTPGVSTVNVSQNSATSGGVWSNPVGTFSYPAVNGQTNRSNLFLLDGVNNQGSFGSTYAVPPIVDDIQEFKVQSHNDDASFGGVLGGVINVVTKSGTAHYHGAAWEFIRNTAFDARNPFLSAVTPFQQNQFGASFGGPLPIPHQGQQKTFFYLSYEGFRNHTAATNFYNTPTSTQLGGDLTGIAGQIYNPYSGQPFMCDSSGNPLPATNNTQPTGTPCDEIPSNMIDSNMLTYAQEIFPAPNLTGNPNFNGLDTTKVITRQDEANFRVDHRFGNRDNAWARFTKFRQPVTGSGGFKGLLHDQTTDGYNLAVSYIHTFSSNSLMELHFGRTDVNINQGTHFSGVSNDLGTQLFSPNFAGNFKNGISMIPEVVIKDGYLGNPDPSAHGAAQIDDTKVSNIWEWGGEFTKVIGHHTFRAGADFASNNSNALYLNSSVQFSATNTANPVDLSGGNALASFLLGIPSVASRRNVIETEHGGWVDGAYFMDQWKVTPKLSVNLGLRYDLTLVPIYGDASHANNFVGDMDFRNGTYILARNAPSCADTNAAPCIPGGTLPDHVVITPLDGGAMYHNDFTNWQPRVGVAYQLFPNTVIRGGFGRFYDNWAAITQTGQNYEGTWPSLDQLGASNMNPVTTGPPNAFAEDPFGLGTAQPVTPPTPFTQSTWFADPYLKRPYSDQWNFGVQQQVTSSTVLTANYVGSVGRKLDVGGAYNVRMQPGPTPDCGNINCGAPFEYIGATAYDRSVGKSNYQALQISLKGIQQRGLTYLVSYTWSKSLDLGCTGWYGVEGCSIQNPYNIQADKGPAATDIPHTFSAAWVYAIPVGRGQKLSSSNSVVNYLIGNWNLNGIVSLNSGRPFDVGSSKDIANTGNYNYGNGYGYERLNLVGSRYPSNKSPVQWINPAGFAVPAQYTFGNLGRDSLRSNWYKNLDLSIFKQFPFTERTRLEFRFEMFNATNTPVWAVPVTNIEDPKFGVVTSTANTARQLQFGLKLIY